jgi:hypothetical protein
MCILHDVGVFLYAYVYVYVYVYIHTYTIANECPIADRPQRSETHVRRPGALQAARVGSKRGTFLGRISPW